MSLEDFLRKSQMPTIEVKTVTGDRSNLTLEIENSEVLLSLERNHLPAEATTVTLGESELEQLMTVVRDLRRTLRRERKSKNRSPSAPSPSP